jgi:hypothetical protein
MRKILGSMGEDKMAFVVKAKEGGWEDYDMSLSMAEESKSAFGGWRNKWR